MTEKYIRKVCVDQTTGTIRRDHKRFHDSAFAPIDSKLFPHSMSLLEEGKAVVEVHITELKTGEPVDASVFQPSDGASSKAGCINPVPAMKIKDVVPRYPEEWLEHDPYRKGAPL
jgi:hypothetical protein